MQKVVRNMKHYIHTLTHKVHTPDCRHQYTHNTMYYIEDRKDILAAGHEQYKEGGYMWDLPCNKFGETAEKDFDIPWNYLVDLYLNYDEKRLKEDQERMVATGGECTHHVVHPRSQHFNSGTQSKPHCFDMGIRPRHTIFLEKRPGQDE